jgi:hypothetical protein
MKKLITLIAAITLAISSFGQSKIVKDFKPVMDSLSRSMKERTTVSIRFGAQNIMKRGNNLDFYFTQNFGDYPWRANDLIWFRKELKRLMPEEYQRYSIGAIYAKRVRVKNLPIDSLTNDGKPFSNRFRTKDLSKEDRPLVEVVGRPTCSKGMNNRHIALWQSHGKYYEQGTQKWQWQRPPLFQTCEDMFTQGFVLPLLVPMLENAGANTLVPRERDTQKHEVIADQDPMFDLDEAEDASLPLRGRGIYEETGVWKDAGVGFADSKAVFTRNENPFRQGRARMTGCVRSADDKDAATAVWTMDVPERGEYAVYISYKSFPASTDGAHYVVKHLGGESEFIVNQKIGGRTWVYLGTFEFSPEQAAIVTLDNVTPQSVKFRKENVVSADAVRLGGGMGNVARRHFKNKESYPELSGMPRYVEGARYSMQWYGADSTVYSQNNQVGDYNDDFMSRGTWTSWLSGGSKINPKEEGLGIPLDLSLGFHTDAGVSPDDSIIGTLAIYTLLCQNSQKLPSGEDRMSCREFTDIMQTQIVEDVRANHDDQWSRRGTWDRSYSESRTPAVPATLLELLSHQNFGDMKFGHDPAFRFTVARAIYKSMLKFLSNRYGVEYVVQPLAVNSFAAVLKSDSEIELSWLPTSDPLEPTAEATGFILQTRVDNGAFDGGKILTEVKTSACGRKSVVLPIQKGKLMSYRIIAINEGGQSFPSEVLSAGIPAGGCADTDKSVLVVNNFDRISAPAWYDSPTVAGFDNSLDSGVPYISDITYIGEQYSNDRTSDWKTNENPGFGASHQDYVGRVRAGNTFDYPSVHGTAIMKAGKAFCSTSAAAFASEEELQSGYLAADIICGKQITTISSSHDTLVRFSVFPENLQDAIRKFTKNGGDILISGSNIATDVWEKIYPIEFNKEEREATKKFVTEVLGYKFATNSASTTAKVVNIARDENFKAMTRTLKFNNEINERIYSVDSPDGILPAAKTAKSIFRYSDSGVTAGVIYNADGYKCVSLGFPIETIEENSTIDTLFECVLKYFE